jgi:putative protease
MDDLEGMANRGFTEGFYRRHVPDEYQNYETGNSTSTKQIFVAEVIDANTETKNLTLEAKNKFSKGDSVSLLTPKGNISFTVGEMINHKTKKLVDVAPGSKHTIELVVPELSQLDISKSELEKALLVRDM